MDYEELKRNNRKAAGRRLKFLLRQSGMLDFFQGGLFEIDVEEAGEIIRESAADKSRASRRSRRSGRGDDDEAAAVIDEDSEADFLQHQPSCIVGGTMRNYQLDGLNWMIRLRANGLNGILADEMGLGKTLQSISMLAYLHEYKNVSGPHLVLVPKTTLSNWLNEFQRWLPALRVVKFHGSKEERAQTAQLLVDGVSKTTKKGSTQKNPTIFGHEGRTWDVVITTYEVANMEKRTLTKLAWRMLLVDEAHRIKNENAQLSKTVRLLQVEHRLLITGTPLQNNLHELWALLNFLLPDIFASSEKFDELFDLQIVDADAKRNIIEQLHKLLRPFVLRRLKHDVEKSLPPKTETLLLTSMTNTQREVYRNCLLREIDVVQSGTGATNGAPRTAVLNLVMQLRKCCNHPYLFPNIEDRTLPPLGEHLIEACGKLKLLDKLMRRLQHGKHRVLIFSQMTRMLDILEDFFVMRQYEYCRIDGNTAHDQREARIDAYNAPNSEKFAFLLSTRAGGLGVNLQTADTVILYDSDWNPQADLQAMDRCHRIGQTKQVHVYRLVTEHSIEEKIVERAQQKLKLDAVVVQQGRLQEKKDLKTETLLHAVRFGADKVFRPAAEITEDDIDAIVERGQKRTAELEAKLAQAEKGDMLDFKLDGGMDVQEWEGLDYSDLATRLQLKPDGQPFFLDTGKRERKKSSTVLYADQLEAKEVQRAIDKEKKKKANAAKNATGTSADETITNVNSTQSVHDSANTNDPNANAPKLNGNQANGAPNGKQQSKAQRFYDDDGELVYISGGDSIFAGAQPRPSHRPIRMPAWLRLPKLEDWQFHEHKQRLLEIQAKEEERFSAYFQGKPERKAEFLRRPRHFDVRRLKLWPDENETLEKLTLYRSGFGSWSKHDYTVFVKASARYGRYAFDKISAELRDKSIAEVQRYAAAFWEKGRHFLTTAEWDRATRTIEKGEKKYEEMAPLFETTKRFVQLFKPSPRSQLIVRFTSTTAGFPQFPLLTSTSTVEERILLSLLVDYGYGNWRVIRDKYRGAPELAMDTFVQTMDIDSVARRTEALMRAADKELSELERRWSAYRSAEQAISAARKGVTRGESGEPLSQPERVARMFEKMRDDHKKQVDLRSELKAAKIAKDSPKSHASSLTGRGTPTGLATSIKAQRLNHNAPPAISIPPQPATTTASTSVNNTTITARPTPAGIGLPVVSTTVFQPAATTATLTSTTTPIPASTQSTAKKRDRPEDDNNDANASNDIDEPPPKKARSALRCYMRHHVRQLRIQQPNASESQLKTMLTAMWEQASPEERTEMERRSELDKVRYERELAEYQARHGVSISPASPASPTSHASIKPAADDSLSPKQASS